PSTPLFRSGLGVHPLDAEGRAEGVTQLSAGGADDQLPLGDEPMGGHLELEIDVGFEQEAAAAHGAPEPALRVLIRRPQGPLLHAPLPLPREAIAALEADGTREGAIGVFGAR